MAELPEREEQIRQAHAGLIQRVVMACQDRSQVPDLEEVLEEAERNGWVQLVVAVRRILEGRRDEQVLFGLDDEDRVVAEAILQGLQDPASLPSGAPPDATNAAPGIAALVQAAGSGDPQAVQWAGQMAEQMSRAGGDMARMAAILRPLVNGERDPEVLSAGMSDQGRKLVADILRELERLEG